MWVAEDGSSINKKNALMDVLMHYSRPESPFPGIEKSF